MKLIDELEKLGAQEVRKRLADNTYGDSRNPNYISVQAWLRSKEVAREETHLEEAIALAREANAVACKANDLALEANKIARDSDIDMRREIRKDRIMTAIAIIIAIIAAHNEISALIVWIGKIIKTP